MSLVQKFRLIVMLEAGYNKGIKEFSGNKIVEVVRRIDFTPKEIYSERVWTSCDKALANMLAYGTRRQVMILSILCLVDSVNCYDSIITSL